MGGFKLAWSPRETAFRVDSLGQQKLLRTTDGDTPFIAMSIRMLSIDAPEVHFPGNTKPSRHDAKLKQLAAWLRTGAHDGAPGVGIGAALKAHLIPKLETGQAGTLQQRQGEAAGAGFSRMLEERLTTPNGAARKLFVATVAQPFDHYGRLLAYVAPSYTAAERATMSLHDRATFNLQLVEEGFAAPFVIFPSLPKEQDYGLFHAAADMALREKRNIWADALTLTGYEFRMCYRLWEAIDRRVRPAKYVSDPRPDPWITRWCADVTTLQLHPPQDYIRVPPQSRLFIEKADRTRARKLLNLVDAPTLGAA